MLSIELLLESDTKPMVIAEIPTETILEAFEEPWFPDDERC